MRRCTRCGQPFEISHVGDFHCPPCHRDVTLILTPPAQPAWLPTWRRAPFAKDLSSWHPGKVA